MSNRPQPNEFNDYYKHYIDLAAGEDILDLLETGKNKTMAFFHEMPGEKHHFKYKEGKWTPKEVLLHLIDTERVFCYRALEFSRAEGAVLPGFDQDVFVENSDANARSMSHLLKEYEAVRTASILFAESCSEETLMKMGTASKNPFSVRALLFMIAGHEIHHCHVLSERYLND